MKTRIPSFCKNKKKRIIKPEDYENGRVGPSNLNLTSPTITQYSHKAMLDEVGQTC